jgi:hypothetical protein
MWYVVETLEGGTQGEFGPFVNLEACTKFLQDSLFPWSSYNMEKIEMVFREENV